MRTWVWFVPAVALSWAAYYMLVGDTGVPVSPRIGAAAGMGAAAALLGLMAAWLSLQLPWMRGGWRSAFVLNGVVSAGFSGLAALLAAGAALGFLQSDPYKPPSRETLETAYMLIEYGTGGAMFWGFVLGSWFAIRRDKYFVEPI